MHFWQSIRKWLCNKCNIRKKENHENFENTFISSTFWTERIGPTAALATLDLMSKIKVGSRYQVLGIKLSLNGEI